MSEAGFPESAMLAIIGHMSPEMLEHYSHIRMAAKREAGESLNSKATLTSKSDGVRTYIVEKLGIIQ